MPREQELVEKKKNSKLFMMDSGQIMKSMELVNKCMLAKVNTLAIGRKANDMEKECLHILTKMYTQDNGKAERKKVKVLMFSSQQE